MTNLEYEQAKITCENCQKADLQGTDYHCLGGYCNLEKLTGKRCCNE